MNERLRQLEDNIAELELFKRKHSSEEIKNDTTKEWALRYGLLESIQIVIDISCHLVVHNNLGNAETYGDCIELLRKFDYIDDKLSKRLKAMAGLRNILVHEYVTVDIDRLYHLLDNLDDFNRFAKAVKLEGL
ncbi:DUF86 domain-containing protein [Aliifodinibius sp. S!AR15-10]|uniref:type VII toxin-antitoxin system HepT family RNase toxin n=1 Tax=Aliifodinibius sp. S!AR15-10 TaxID=2950437 RepID=UPI0028617B2D|nr:DUF86 domain-containing protein [Aliifodinibius sp. S!AR15-10]MDR8393397.1 DUF86 domain-containing protein [Aliifodinibius sp. S!AR15-10]